jgi:hypothetical protein
MFVLEEQISILVKMEEYLQVQDLLAHVFVLQDLMAQIVKML